jgi:hypothetical protein
MTKTHFLKISLAVLLLANLSACGLAQRGVAALRSTDHFVPLQSDRRVLYEPGSEDLAQEVAGVLNAAAAQVEQEQYRPFPKPIAVYICASEESFSRHTGMPRQVRAAVTVRLFLSAPRLREPGAGADVRGYLTHELSHLHLQQQLGVYGFGSHLPGWFREGLAVNVSGGAGAQTVSEAEAAAAIVAGQHIVPNDTESFFFPKYGSAFGLEAHLFYRQSAMFVAYLKRINEARFREFVLMLEDGQSFKKSFKKVFGTDVGSVWQHFVEGLKRG